VYGFVQRSKGTIKVYSELEHGARFSLYFPRYAGEGEIKEAVPEDLIELGVRKIFFW